MDNKKLFIFSMHRARLEQSKWIASIKRLINDPKSQVENTFFDTYFSQWFKNTACYLLFHDECNTLKKVETLIQDLDGEYNLYYNIVIVKRKKSFIGSFKPLTSHEESAASRYLRAIKIINEQIDVALETLDKNIVHMNENNFDFMSTIQTDTNLNLEQEKKSDSKKSNFGARGAYQDN